MYSQQHVRRPKTTDRSAAYNYVYNPYMTNCTRYSTYSLKQLVRVYICLIHQQYSLSISPIIDPHLHSQCNIPYKYIIYKSMCVQLQLIYIPQLQLVSKQTSNTIPAAPDHHHLYFLLCSLSIFLLLSLYNILNSLRIYFVFIFNYDRIKRITHTYIFQIYFYFQFIFSTYFYVVAFNFRFSWADLNRIFVYST